MLKQIAWNTFKNTGDINTFMELTKVDKAMDMAKDKNEKVINNNESEISQDIKQGFISL